MKITYYSGIISRLHVTSTTNRTKLSLICKAMSGKKEEDQRKPRIWNLIQCVGVVLSLIAAVEYFKYSTRIHYDWFHCTPIMEPLDSSENPIFKVWARGGPSCDKRGEFKTIVKSITRGFEPAKSPISFCIKENTGIPAIHYPIHEDKGEPGYIAYVEYTTNDREIQKICQNSTILHM
ncbi:hypothetical protein NCAS_0F02110 [Naumovozyma castellii]|uniref:Ceramide synthase subunit LIP1 n=1 Tax=Naumovozyma castellii TaxID=27288 RepID=G0VGS4_NAUCA|nr:hypothetical protein NCAS_0F02110 [Naumovozyma castellii CBS 4309]CCC70695.1 hypothetical protein NCAS_0F02110 [Naumovozyma castellii CBS 4309]